MTNNVFLLLFLSLFMSASHAAVFERLGGMAYYDTITNLTWLRDANYAQTSGYDSDGLMNWSNANAWAASLNIEGITGWRLPSVNDVGNDGYTYTNFHQGVDFGYNIDTENGELAKLYYDTLGNIAAYDIDGTTNVCPINPNTCLTNVGPFINIDSHNFWTSTAYTPNNNTHAWVFRTHDGNQDFTDMYRGQYAWAVHDGDVAPPVPVPAAAWLFGTGLLGLISVARRNKA